MKTNFHTHSLYCDGDHSPEEMIQAAIAKGFNVLGFSGHSYTDFDESYCMSLDGTQQYKAEIRSLRERYSPCLEILLGIEQDHYSAQATDDYDFVISSVHYIKRSGIYCPVDESSEELTRLVAEHWTGDWMAMCRDYYRTVAEIPVMTRCQIIGHLDLVTKFNRGGRLFDQTCPEYLAAAYEAAAALADKGALFELNTGAMARGLLDEPYPSIALADFIAGRGGRFILSSDCHHSSMLDAGFDRVLELAAQRGWVLVDRPFGC